MNFDECVQSLVCNLLCAISAKPRAINRFLAIVARFSRCLSKQKRRATSVRVISRRSCAEISVLRLNGEENVNKKTHTISAAIPNSGGTAIPNSGGTAIPNSGGTAIPNSGGTAIPIFIYTHLNRYPAPRCGGLKQLYGIQILTHV